MLRESILQYFRPSLRYHLSLRSLFWLFLNGRFTQVLLYCNKKNLDTMSSLRTKLQNLNKNQLTFSLQRCDEKIMQVKLSWTQFSDFAIQELLSVILGWSSLCSAEKTIREEMSSRIYQFLVWLIQFGCFQIVHYRKDILLASWSIDYSSQPFHASHDFFSGTLDRDFPCFYLCEIFLSHTPVAALGKDKKWTTARWPHVDLWHHYDVKMPSPCPISGYSGYSGSLFQVFTI